MRKAALAVLVGFALLFVASLPAQAITFGQLDGNLHPNVGGLVVEFTPGEKFLICSGTLISPTVFLTASHCTAFLPSVGIGPHDVWVTFDSVLSQTGTFYRGTYHTNPLYGHDAADPHDIAVIVLDQAVQGITPATLPTAGELDELAAKAGLKDQEFTAVGYGGVRTDKTGGWHYITYDDTRRYASQYFLSLTPAWLRLSENISTGSGGTCYGDSGGPHFMGDKTSNLVVALTVTGDANCRA
ncbi:MAG: trypsin-like serine protease, partial [Rudaea sp.]